MNSGRGIICLSSSEDEVTENFSQSKKKTVSANSPAAVKRHKIAAHSLSASDVSADSDPASSKDDDFCPDNLPSLNDIFNKSLKSRCRVGAHSLSNSDDSDSNHSSNNDDLQNNREDLDKPTKNFSEVKDYYLPSIHAENAQESGKLEESRKRSPRKQAKSRGKLQKCEGKEAKDIEKQKKKELSKALKDIHREMQRKNKPEERLKSMRMVLDNCLKNIPGYDDLFAALHAFDFKITEECNPIPYSVIWYHQVTEVSIENNKAQKVLHEEPENFLFVYITASFFVEMVQAFIQKRKGSSSFQCQTLLDYIANIKQSFSVVDITCVTIKLESYLREMLEEKKKNKDLKGNEKYSLPNVSKKDVEEAMIDVQIQVPVNFRLLDNINQFADLLGMYTKALAEAPLKREKHRQQGFSWYADADSNCPVKIAKDGTGLINLWQQQIQQFQNVGKEVAQAIAAKYPSPMLLLEAYRKCKSKQEAENLLQDIVIRRDFGPLGTTRKIGPELSYKICLFFTSKDENKLLQR